MAQVTELQAYALSGQIHAFSAKGAAPVYASYGTPFLFEDRAWWDGEFVLEAYVRAISGATAVRVFDETDSAAVANSEVSTNSATLTRLRSGGIKLTHDHTYRSQVRADVVNQSRALGADMVYVRPGRLRTPVQDSDEARRSLHQADLGERRFTFFALAEELTV